MKKGKTGIVVAVALGIGILAGCGTTQESVPKIDEEGHLVYEKDGEETETGKDNPENTTPEHQEPEKQETDGIEADSGSNGNTEAGNIEENFSDPQDIKKGTDGRHLVGEKVLFETEDGGIISIMLTDWGTTKGASEETVLYVKYLIENLGEESCMVGPGLFSIYADDYSVEKAITLEDIGSSPTNLSSGRKTEGIFYGDVNPENVAVIELECGGEVFLIKDSSFGTPGLSQIDTEQAGGTTIQIPADLVVAEEKIESYELSGYYGGFLSGQSTLDLSIYSSPETEAIGIAEIYSGAGYNYRGEIMEIATNVYQVATETGEEVLLGVLSEEDEMVILSLYVNGLLVEEYNMIEHYES